MNVFDMPAEQFDRWVEGAREFGGKMVEKGIDIIELNDRGIEITPGPENPVLEGALLLGFTQFSIERLSIHKHGDPVFLTELHIHHTDGESVLGIPDMD